MHLSLKTLHSIVPLPSDVSVQEIADKLTFAGLEIESIKDFEDDTILELKITPNRPDALSHLGVARELAAAFHVRTHIHHHAVKELGPSVHDLLQVHVLAKEACPRYTARIIEGVQVAESPEWLQKKLLSLGLKPINNVVDVTTWVLFELGQPLHAFDLDTLAKPRGRISLKIRHAEADETLVTLDGKTRSLQATDLVIADEDKALALAAIMGGKDSSVSESTQHVLLESAYFEPTRIRLTAKRLQMSTDSSYRFERGTDPNGVVHALDRAASLIQELAGGRIRREIIDVYPKVIEPKEVSLRPARLASLSALPESELDHAKLRTRFLALGIETAGRAAHDALKFRVPTFRPDITEEIDLIEEAMRLIGFEHVPASLSLNMPGDAVHIDSSLDRLESVCRLFLSQAGFFEAINYAFSKPNSKALSLMNPLGEEFSTLRQSLIPALMKNVADNLRQQIKKAAFFEIGTVFLGLNPNGQKPNPDSISQEDMAPDAYAKEQLLLAGIVSNGDFYALKGALESLFEQLKIKPVFEPASKNQLPHFFHPAQSASIRIGSEKVGFIGVVHPDFKEHSKDCIFELDVKRLATRCFETVQFEALPKFPSIDRDLALVVAESVLGAELVSAVHAFKPLSKILESVHIFDVYRGKGIEPGQKSMALSLTLRDDKKTLTEAVVQPIFESLIQDLCERFKATLRFRMF